MKRVNILGKGGFMLTTGIVITTGFIALGALVLLLIWEYVR